MSNPLVIAFILTYNDSSIVKKCIETVRNSDYENLDIYLIDNGSKPHFLKDIKESFNDLQLIPLEKNIGYTGAFNMAMKRLHKKLKNKIGYFWLLNNDLEVDSNALTKMVREASSFNDIGFIGPETFKRGSSEDHDQWITYRVFEKNPGKIGFKNEMDYGEMKKIEVDYVVGHCLLVKREVLETVGLLRDVFIYFDETEWQWRAKKRGWKSFVIPKSKVFHDRNSFDKPINTYFRTRNYIFFNRVVLDSDIFFLVYFFKNIFFIFKDLFGSLRRGLITKLHLKSFLRGVFHGFFYKIPQVGKLDE